MIDFDGVIHSYTSKWINDEIISGSPILDSFKNLNEYLDYFDVFIFSTRCRTSAGIEAIRKWFKKFGFKRIDELNFTFIKIPAFLFIDDRALQFKGIFPTTEEIMKFKPWLRDLPLKDSFKFQKGDNWIELRSREDSLYLIVHTKNEAKSDYVNLEKLCNLLIKEF